jgi:plasmid stability protein
VATLNIKDFPDALYEELRGQAERERRSVDQEVVHLLDQALHRSKPLSILGLQGLGKDLWKGIDAAAYILEERDSWDS